jgi:nucleoside-diphosphate-sugar epimerase
MGRLQVGESRAYGIANRFIQTAVAGKTINLFGDGGQRRDYLYIDDLVDAFLRAGFAENARGKIYNIGDRTSVSLLELAEKAIAAAGRGKIERVPWPEDFLAIETGDYQSDISLAQRELGWLPITDISDGISRTAAFYKH